jgi:hypothetical protein
MASADAGLPPGHTPFTPAALTNRTWWDAARAAIAPAELEGLHAWADTVPLEAPAQPATVFLAARRHNNRSASDDRWQEDRGVLSLLALRRALNGIEPHDADDRLTNWLWALATDPTWAVVAHLPGQTLPRPHDPVLDLAACEMAALLAELVEVLGPWMVSVSEALPEALLGEIDRRVIRPYERDPERWWWNVSGTRPLNNWTGVCAGSILAACRSMASVGHPRPVAESQAIAALRLFLREAFTPTGECDEGLSYWNYGMSIACLGWSRLSAGELAAAVDLDRLRQVAAFPGRVHLAGDLFWAGNDSGGTSTAARDFVPWLGRVTADPFLPTWRRPPLHLAAGQLARTGDLAREKRRQSRHFGMILRALASAVEESSERPAPPPHPAARYLPDQQVAIFSQTTPRGTLFACLTGGHNAESHNHNDLGTLILTLGDQTLLPDLGAPFYSADFFGPKRYSYLSAGSQGHSCPQINGYEQRAGSDAAAQLLAYDPANRRLSLDLTAAYPPEAGLARWVRTLQPSASGRGAFELIDELDLTEPGDVLHRMWSVAPASHVDHNGWQAGPLSVRWSSTAAAASVLEFDPAEHRLRDYAPPTKLYRVDALFRGKTIRLVTTLGLENT